MFQLKTIKHKIKRKRIINIVAKYNNDINVKILDDVDFSSQMIINKLSDQRFYEINSAIFFITIKERDNLFKLPIREYHVDVSKLKLSNSCPLLSYFKGYVKLYINDYSNVDISYLSMLLSTFKNALLFKKEI